MGPIWGRQDPGGPHVGPMTFAIWVVYTSSVHRHSILWQQEGIVFHIGMPWSYECNSNNTSVT